MHNIKKRFVPHFAVIEESTDHFKNLLESVNTKNIKEGTVVKGQVISVSKDVIVVDVGLKNEGRIAIEEFANVLNQALPEVGDVIDVYVEKVEGKNGKTVLSRAKARREESWINLEHSYDKKEFVQGAIFGRVKGGFTVDLSGVIAFLPGSQVDVRPIRDTSSLIGLLQPFLILKMDKKLGNIVVSRRAVLEESRSEARNEVLATIKEGEIYEGIVKNITDYGAFVDLGNIDGLLHVTDISWGRINHPSEVLSIGQKIRVMIIKFNEDNKRISLGMKQLDDTLWKEIEGEFVAGNIFTGKITNISDYGAFIELKNGIEGLVHATEISWLKSQQNPKKALTIGQEVQFKILEIDIKKHRIALSIKQCQENPLVLFANKHPIGSVITVPVRNVTDFGIFVGVSEQFDGMIHESDISWDDNGSQLLQSFKKGQEIECKVLVIDVEKERISLGIKQLTEKSDTKSVESDLKKNMHVTCVVTSVKDDGIEVNIDDQVIGFIKKSELSSEKSGQKPELFAVGDRVDAKITYIDRKNNKITLSIKALEVEEREKAIKEYGSTDSGARLGDILGTALGEDKN